MLLLLSRQAGGMIDGLMRLQDLGNPMSSTPSRQPQFTLWLGGCWRTCKLERVTRGAAGEDDLGDLQVLPGQLQVAGVFFLAQDTASSH